jgi:hypothetical protein
MLPVTLEQAEMRAEMEFDFLKNRDNVGEILCFPSHAFVFSGFVYQQVSTSD